MNKKIAHTLFHFIICLLGTTLLTGCSSAQKRGAVDKQAYLYRQLAFSHLKKNNLPATFKALKQADNLTPNSSENANLYGLAYIASGKTTDAEKSFRKAIKLNPKNTEARNNFASFLIKQGKYSEALTEAQAASQDLLYPHPLNSLTNLGLALYYLNKYPEAIHTFTQLVNKVPSSCTFQTFLARSHSGHRKHSGKAEGAWEKTRKICSTPTVQNEARFELAKIYIKSHRKVEAKALLEQILLKGQKTSFYEKSLSLYTKIYKSGSRE